MPGIPDGHESVLGKGHSHPGCAQCGSRCPVKKRPVTFPNVLSTGSATRVANTNRPSGHPVAEGTRLDAEGLGRVVDFYVGQALADSTRRSYLSAKKRYLNFCTLHKVTPIPTNEQLLCHYVAFLAKSGLAASSIKCYLAAMRNLQITEGKGDPNMSAMSKLDLVVRGVKRTQARDGQRRPRHPITPELLLMLRKAWLDPARGHDGVMLWAVASLCFFGFLRSGEVTIPTDTSFDKAVHLTFEDFAVDNLKDPTMVRARLKSSKTDPFRKGVDIVVGRTGNRICPVAAMLGYLRARGAGPGPLFRFKEGKPLTKPRFVSQVRETLQARGIDGSSYSGHSFRSGAATTAARAGVEDSTIKMLGRWKSDAYQLYIKTPRHHLAAISTRLAATQGQDS